MSDNGGRRLSFIVPYTIFIVANIGLALQTKYATLLVLRMVQAIGSRASIVPTIKVVADIATSAERGKHMGYATASIFFGPAFGHTIGGILTQYPGWRSIFWFLAIYGGVLLMIFVFFFPETCRNMVGNGSIPAKGINQLVLSYLQHQSLARHSNLEGEGLSPIARNRKIIFPNPLTTLRILGEKDSYIVLL